MSTRKRRVPNSISKGRPRPQSPALVSDPVGKPRHDFGTCIACAACAASCPTSAIRIFIDEDEGMLIWTLDLGDCTYCGACADACPTGAMGLIEDCAFADEPELPKRCAFALRECDACGRYYATYKEVDYANDLLEQQDNADAARARALTSRCPDCKRTDDAEAAARRITLRRR